MFIIASPSSELLDETLRIHREPDWPDHVVVDERHRNFFESVRSSLEHALSKLEQIKFVALDDDEENDLF